MLFLFFKKISFFEKVLIGYFNGNFECFLFYYDFLFEYFKVFLLEVVLNKMMDFDWMVIML